MKNIFVLGSVMLLAAAGAAYAYPSLPGPSGNAAFPTATVIPAGVIDIAADFDNNTEIPGAPGTPSHVTKPDYPIRVLYGLKNNMEIGLAYNPTMIDGSAANFTSVNAKYQFAKPVKGFTVAVGGRLVHSNATLDVSALVSAPPGSVYLSGEEDTLVAYLVGTKAFTLSEKMAPVNGTIGIHFNGQQTDFNLPGTSDQRFSLRAFFGADTKVCDKLTLSAEYQPAHIEEDYKPAYALTARYPITELVNAEVGYTNLDQAGILGLEEGKIFAGLDIAFDTTK